MTISAWRPELRGAALAICAAAVTATFVTIVSVLFHLYGNHLSVFIGTLEDLAIGTVALSLIVWTRKRILQVAAVLSPLYGLWIWYKAFGRHPALLREIPFHAQLQNFLLAAGSAFIAALLLWLLNRSAAKYTSPAATTMKR